MYFTHFHYQKIVQCQNCPRLHNFQHWDIIWAGNFAEKVNKRFLSVMSTTKIEGKTRGLRTACFKISWFLLAWSEIKKFLLSWSGPKIFTTEKSDGIVRKYFIRDMNLCKWKNIHAYQYMHHRNVLKSFFTVCEDFIFYNLY